MRIPVLACLLSLTGALAAQAGTAPAAPAKPAAVGEPVPDFEFPAFWNGDGRQKLSEFYGQPILVEFWGTR